MLNYKDSDKIHKSSTCLQKNSKNEAENLSKPRGGLSNKDRFLHVFSLSWRPQTVAAAAGNYFGRTIISVYRYIAVVQQDSNDGVQSGTVKYHKATPTPCHVDIQYRVKRLEFIFIFLFFFRLNRPSEKNVPQSIKQKDRCVARPSVIK